MPAFLERTIKGMLATAEYAAIAENRAEGSALLQRIDPRVKLVGLMALIVAVVASHGLLVIAVVFLLAVLLAAASNIELRHLAGWIWAPVLFFTGLIALPSVYLVSGGARSAAFLLSRAETAATLSALLVFSTPWAAILKSLRSLGVPVVIVVMLGMTYRYIFSVLGTAADMMESRKSRTVGVLKGAESRRIAAGAAGVLLGRSLQLSGDIHLAMLSRGFRGEVYSLRESRMAGSDWCWLALFLTAAACAFWMGR